MNKINTKISLLLITILALISLINIVFIDTSRGSSTGISTLFNKDVSAIRITLDELGVYGILVDGLGYGVDLRELLDGRTSLMLFKFSDIKGLEWVKRLEGEVVFKTRGLTTWNGRIYLAYTSIDKSSISRLNILSVDSNGSLIEAVSLETSMNAYLGIPGFVNDLKVDRGYVYVVGGWHLYAQRHPYNITPFLYVLDLSSKTGYRLVFRNASGYEPSGGFYSVDVYDGKVYVCGGLFDLFHEGSRADFIVASISDNGMLEWVVAFDLNMGIDYCRSVKRLGEYIYVIGRSWLNGLGDHVIFARIRLDGKLDEVKAIRIKAEPISMMLIKDKIIVLLGHSSRTQLMILNTTGDLEGVIELTSLQYGLDLALRGEKLLVAGASSTTTRTELIIEIPIDEVIAHCQSRQHIKCVDISSQDIYEMHFNINMADVDLLLAITEPVALSSYSVNLLDVPLYETKPPSEHFTTEPSITLTTTETLITESEHVTHTLTATESKIIDQTSPNTNPYGESIIPSILPTETFATAETSAILDFGSNNSMRPSNMYTSETSITEWTPILETLTTIRNEDFTMSTPVALKTNTNYTESTERRTSAMEVEHAENNEPSLLMVGFTALALTLLTGFIVITKLRVTRKGSI